MEKEKSRPLYIYEVRLDSMLLFCFGGVWLELESLSADVEENLFSLVDPVAISHHPSDFGMLITQMFFVVFLQLVKNFHYFPLALVTSLIQYVGQIKCQIWATVLEELESSFPVNTQLGTKSISESFFCHRQEYFLFWHGFSPFWAMPS